MKLEIFKRSSQLVRGNSKFITELQKKKSFNSSILSNSPDYDAPAPTVAKSKFKVEVDINQSLSTRQIDYIERIE